MPMSMLLLLLSLPSDDSFSLILGACLHYAHNSPAGPRLVPCAAPKELPHPTSSRHVSSPPPPSLACSLNRSLARVLSTWIVRPSQGLHRHHYIFVCLHILYLLYHHLSSSIYPLKITTNLTTTSTSIAININTCTYICIYIDRYFSFISNTYIDKCTLIRTRACKQAFKVSNSHQYGIQYGTNKLTVQLKHKEPAVRTLRIVYLTLFLQFLSFFPPHQPNLVPQKSKHSSDYLFITHSLSFQQVSKRVSI